MIAHAKKLLLSIAGEINSRIGAFLQTKVLLSHKKITAFHYQAQTNALTNLQYYTATGIRQINNNTAMTQLL